MKKSEDTNFCIDCKHLDRKDIKINDRDTFRCKKHPNKKGIDPLTGKEIFTEVGYTYPTNHKNSLCATINKYANCPKYKKQD